MRISWTVFRFSWRQKLWFVISVAMAGLLLVISASFVGLNSVNNSIEQQNISTQYRGSLTDFYNHFLEIELLANEMDSQSIDRYLAFVSKAEMSIKELSDVAQKLNLHVLVDDASQLKVTTDDYLSERLRWIENRQKLGFNSSEGKIKAIFLAMGAVEDVAYLIDEKPVRSLSENQLKFIETGHESYEKNMLVAVDKLKTIISLFGSNENPVSNAVLNYVPVFVEVRTLIAVDRQIVSLSAELVAEIRTLVDQQKQYLDNELLDQVFAESDQTRSSAKKIISASGILVALVVFSGLAYIAHQLTAQLRAIQLFLKQVAGGDFSTFIPVGSNKKDEFVILRQALNEMVTNISKTIEKVLESNSSMSVLKVELQKAIGLLSQSSEKVEQKTQQSSVATNQISLSVNDVAERSVDVSDKTKTALNMTQEGGIHVRDSANSMVKIAKLIEDVHEKVNRLTRSNTEMLGIIDVINGLADQTNLLALNAAIESARAGEAGRGFSVVADEVRALAQKTVSATSNIGDIVKGFNEQSSSMKQLMERGITLSCSGQQDANKVMESFSFIEESIELVAEQMTQVVVAVEDISYNSNDIAGQVSDISDQTSANKEIRLSLEQHVFDISTQAEHLRDAASRFKV